MPERGPSKSWLLHLWPYLAVALLSCAVTASLITWSRHSDNRPVEIRATNHVVMALTNRTGIIWPPNRLPFTYTFNPLNVAPPTWPAQHFYTNQITLTFLTNSVYHSPSNLTMVAYNNVFDASSDFLSLSNRIGLIVTNRLQYILIDTNSHRVIDMVNIDGLIASVDISGALLLPPDFQGDNLERDLWSATLAVPTQVDICLSNRYSSDALWSSYSRSAMSGQQKRFEIDLFRVFCGDQPLFYPITQVRQTLGNNLTHQSPFNPTRRFVQIISAQVNDPLVHYTLEDLVDLTVRTNNVQVLRPPSTPRPPTNLGQRNPRYRPWQGNPDKPDPATDFDLGLKDPLVRQSDDWDFPTNFFPNLGTLGRVHRGTPWQTLYLKAYASTNNWQAWSGANHWAWPLTHPTNDWAILELFTTAPNDNAARGLLSVNQTNRAAWAAVLSGIWVLSNTAPATVALNSRPQYMDLWIDPATWQLDAIVGGINARRAPLPSTNNLPERYFNRLGDILSVPELTIASPFLNRTGPAMLERGLTDAAYERIPQQILSLLKEDSPRMVTYAYGQALEPAPNSILLSGNLRGVCTNYVITSEVVIKTLWHVEGTPIQPRVVVDSFDVLNPD